jgi:hypothetical protein
MNRLPFENLKDSMQFQQLCAELLQAEGCKNIRGLGTGADQGNDFMFDLPVDSPLSSELKPFIAQCKWYGIKSSVAQNEVSDSAPYIDTHNASGMLLITSSQFTGTAITKIEAINRSTRNSYQINYWNGTDLTKRLRKHTEIINKFFYSSENKKTDEQLPVYDEESFLNEFGLHPSEKIFSADTFPEIPGNESFVHHLREFSKTYLANPPGVVLLSGVIGAGKTGYGFSLLNLKAQQGMRIAYLRFSDYKDRYFQYHSNEDDTFLPFFRFCQETDVLFLDDFGMFMTDKSKALIDVAQSYTDLVEKRTENGKLTLLAIPGEPNYGKTIENYLEYLKGIYPTVSVGDISVRSYIGNRNISTTYASGEKMQLLGKDWLIEKSESVAEDITRAIDALLRPEEKDISLRHHLHEQYGDSETRQDEILDCLKLAKKRLDEYKQFIMPIDFHAFSFRENGEIEIIRNQ